MTQKEGVLSNIDIPWESSHGAVQQGHRIHQEAFQKVGEKKLALYG